MSSRDIQGAFKGKGGEKEGARNAERKAEEGRTGRLYNILLPSRVRLWYNDHMNKSVRVLKGIGIFLLSVSWCALQTLIGAVLFLVLLPGGRAARYRGMIVLYHRSALTFSLGVFAFISNKADGAGEARGHLFGHFVQSCIAGPFYLFFVTLPQLLVRIPALRRRRLERGKTPDDVYFERSARSLSAFFGE